jgi:hypothetical protein
MEKEIDVNVINKQVVLLWLCNGIMKKSLEFPKVRLFLSIQELVSIQVNVDQITSEEISDSIIEVLT